MRFRHEAIPVPVPRFGAGKTSGVLGSLSVRLTGLRSKSNYVLSVQHTIHDVLEERLKASHRELVVGIGAPGE